MARPKIEVLGVYHLDVTDELVRQQREILYGQSLSPEKRANADRACRKQLESVALIEILISNRDEHFGIGDFAQGSDDESEENWQVAWAEAFLTADGESLSVERWSAAPGDDPLRMAFFIHYWDSMKPLQTSYGELRCPAPRPMPERLSRLVPYEPCD